MPTSTKVESPVKGVRLKSLDPATLLYEQDKSTRQFEQLILKPPGSAP